MKRSLYMMSLVLGLVAGQAIQAVEEADSKTVKMDRIKKSYPKLAMVLSSMSGAKSILECWAESTNPEKRDLLLENLFFTARFMHNYKELFKELDSFMTEYGDEISDQIKQNYYKDVRSKFMR